MENLWNCTEIIKGHDLSSLSSQKCLKAVGPQCSFRESGVNFFLSRNNLLKKIDILCLMFNLFFIYLPNGKWRWLYTTGHMQHISMVKMNSPQPNKSSLPLWMYLHSAHLSTTRPSWLATHSALCPSCRHGLVNQNVHLLIPALWFFFWLGANFGITDTMILS